MADMGEQLRRVGQKNQTALLRGLSEVSQKRVAELVGMSESSLSEFKDTRLERFAMIAAACGLKLVAVNAQSFDDKHIEALRTLARIGLQASERHSDMGELE